MLKLGVIAMIRRFVSVAFAATCLAATPALAWGPEGHTIIARAAVSGSRLTPQAAADWKWLLAVGIPALNATTKACIVDPNDPFKPIANPRDTKVSNIANWPDCYRDLNSKTANWHFDDIPLDQTPGAVATPDPWCTSTGCVSAAFADNLNKLAATPTNPADAARALVYVIHFAGDIHQPLHASDNQDRGGNEVLLKMDKSGVKSPDLHGMWDTPLVQVAYGKDYDAAAQKLTTDTLHPPAAWTAGMGSVASAASASRTWIADSHKLGIPAYQKLDPPPSAPGPYTATVHKQYVVDESPVVAGQLQRATVRLTAALNAALTWDPPK